MLLLLKGLSRCYYPRIYIVADSDTMSTEKIENFEQQNKVYYSYGYISLHLLQGTAYWLDKRFHHHIFQLL